MLYVKTIRVRDVTSSIKTITQTLENNKQTLINHSVAVSAKVLIVNKDDKSLKT